MAADLGVEAMSLYHYVPSKERLLDGLAEALVVEMGGDPIWVPEANRALYHAALSYGANYLITLVAQSLELLSTAGIEQPQRIIAPLLSASLDNALRLGDHALTGPVARGDAESVARQLAAIARVSEQAAVGYQALARVTADRAVAAGTLAVSYTHLTLPTTSRV